MSSMRESKSSTLIKIMSTDHSYSGLLVINHFRISAHYLIAFKGVQYSWETLASIILLNATYRAAWWPFIISLLSIIMTISAFFPFQSNFFFLIVNGVINSSSHSSKFSALEMLVSKSKSFSS